eukprot:11548511-Prorocentrum_lima.AAC.1
MSLKSVVVRIVDVQGIQLDMYNRKYRWSGTYDIVDYMCGTDILEANSMTGRLLQTYRSMGLFPEVHHGIHWVVSPPCAELQDLAKHIRTSNHGAT